MLLRGAISNDVYAAGKPSKVASHRHPRHSELNITHVIIDVPIEHRDIGRGVAHSHRAICSNAGNGASRSAGSSRRTLGKCHVVSLPPLAFFVKKATSFCDRDHRLLTTSPRILHGSVPRPCLLGTKLIYPRPRPRPLTTIRDRYPTQNPSQSEIVPSGVHQTAVPNRGVNSLTCFTSFGGLRSELSYPLNLVRIQSTFPAFSIH